MLQIHPLPALRDNYIWILECADKSSVYVVDPGDPKPVQAYLASQNKSIEAILVTHQHWDHVTGIAELVSQYHCPVFGPAIEQRPEVIHPLSEGDSIKLWGDFEAEVMETPGHMPDHICWKITEGDQIHLLCADIIFSAGCGRIFRGTPEELRLSLDRIAALPPSTKLYCAHEYTLANLSFALTVEPDNPVLQDTLISVNKLRKLNKPSLPTTVARERSINPFLRYHQQAVANSVRAYAGRDLESSQQVFTELRLWKDVY